MSRLRVRIELNRGGVGVPLDKLASVVQQAQAFFRMLGDDVHIDQRQGEWLGFDFDHESLNFTAEFVGPVTADQVAEFHSAFDGTTPLRRDTIAQFARIADAIDEDEVIGFGLYLNQGEDPEEWRCLSRRDALRITDEIRSLLVAGESGQESHLPAVADVNTGARYLFGRRDRAQESAKLAGAVKEVEANLSKRISRLEGEVADHSGHIQDLRSKSMEAEISMGRLLSAVEGFCEQAATRLETVTAPVAAAAAVPTASLPLAIESQPAPQSSIAPASQVSPTPPSVAVPTPILSASPAAAAVLSSPRPSGAPAHEEPRLAEPEAPTWWRSPTAISVGLVVAAILMGMLLWPGHPADRPEAASAPDPGRKAAPAPAPSIPPQAPPAKPASLTASTSEPAKQAGLGATRIELEASEPSWVSIRGGDGATQVARLIQPGNIQSVDIREPAVLRAGNAGGLTIRANGKSLGPLGPHGAVREVAFKDGEFKLVPVK
jgi:hypothetical protein